jgi:serine/threonine-protein kinase TTK/MPS1
MIYGNPPFNSITGGPLAKMAVIADPQHQIDYPDITPPRGLSVGQANSGVHVPPEVIDSMRRSLTYRKEHRLTIPELLQHEFLKPKTGKY